MGNAEIIAVLLITLVVIGGIFVYLWNRTTGDKNYMQAYDETNKEQAPWYEPPQKPTNSTVTNSTGGG